MRFLKSEAGAVVLWVVASILLASLVAPWIFGIGKDFALRHGDSDGLAGWLAGSCERAKFGRYFNRCLMLSALFLLWPLLWRIRLLGRGRPGPLASLAGIGWRLGLRHGAAGFAIAAGLLGLLGVALAWGGAFMPLDGWPSTSALMKRVLLPAIGASLAEEWLFRALLLGLWLRITGPWQACMGTAAVYAFVHFLEPPKGHEIADPQAATAGFELLGLILRNFLNPQFIAAEFLTLFTVGLALGWARLKTNSLWLPIGMHAGWIFAFKCFNQLHAPVTGHPLQPWLIGPSLKNGLLPLATLAISWWLINRIMNQPGMHCIPARQRSTNQA
jgi:membrane protease YdiL (CAAX protease family)